MASPTGLTQDPHVEAPRAELGPMIAVLGAGAGAVVLTGLWPGPVAIAVWTLAFALAGLRWPVAMLVIYAILEPFQRFLVSGPEAWPRYFDEGVMLTFSVLVLGREFFRRPAAVLRDPFLWTGLGFIALGLASARLNQVPLINAGAGMFVTLDYFAWFLALRYLRLPGRAVKAVTFTWVLGGLVTISAALVQKLGGPTFKFGWQMMIEEHGVRRVSALFEHPNDVGFFLLLPLCIGVGWLLANQRSWWPWLVVLMAIGGSAVAVSRSTFLALAVVGLASLLLIDRRHWSRVLPAVVAVSLVAAIAAGPGVKARIAKVRAENGDARLSYLRAAVPIVLSSPALGVGPGTFGGEVAFRFGSEVYRKYDIQFTDDWRTVDNFWVHLIVESGALGTAAFLLILVLAALRARGQLSTETDPWRRAGLMGVPLLVGAYCALGTAANVFEANAHAGPLWMTLGMLLWAGERPAKQPSPTPVA